MEIIDPSRTSYNMPHIVLPCLKTEVANIYWEFTISRERFLCSLYFLQESGEIDELLSVEMHGPVTWTRNHSLTSAIEAILAGFPCFRFLSLFRLPLGRCNCDPFSYTVRESLKERTEQAKQTFTTTKIHGVLWQTYERPGFNERDRNISKSIRHRTTNTNNYQTV